MSDALRQLHDAANVLAESGLRTVKTNDLCIAVYGAIDEITRLREALKHYACNCAEGKCESSDVDSFTCGSRARAALAEKGGE